MQLQVRRMYRTTQDVFYSWLPASLTNKPVTVRMIFKPIVSNNWLLEKWLEKMLEMWPGEMMEKRPRKNFFGTCQKIQRMKRLCRNVLDCLWSAGDLGVSEESRKSLRDLAAYLFLLLVIQRLSVRMVTMLAYCVIIQVLHKIRLPWNPDPVE